MDVRADLEQAIAALEAQRVTLGDAVVDVSVAALREKLAASQRAQLHERRSPGERKTVTVVLARVGRHTSTFRYLSYVL